LKSHRQWRIWPPKLTKSVGVYFFFLAAFFFSKASHPPLPPVPVPFAWWIELALVNVKHVITKNEISKLQEASEKAGTSFKELEPSTQALIEERIATLKKISEEMNRILGGKTVDLSERLKDPDNAGATVDEILESVLESLAPRGAMALAQNKACQELSAYLTNVLQERKGGRGKVENLEEVKTRVGDFHLAEFPRVVKEDQATLERIGVYVPIISSLSSSF